MNNARRKASFHVNMLMHVALILLPLCVFLLGAVALFAPQLLGLELSFSLIAKLACLAGLYLVCGIWHFIWVYRTTDQLNADWLDLPRNPVTKTLLIIFLPCYFIFWYDQSAKRTDRLANGQGLKSGLRTTFDVAAIVFGSIAVLCLMMLGSLESKFLATPVARIVIGAVLAIAAVAVVIMVLTPILIQAKMNKIAAAGAELQIRGLKNRSADDMVLYTITEVILFILLLVVAYPIIYVVSCSFSNGIAVSSGQVVLWPVNFSLQGYKIIFHYRSVWVGFANSIFYTVVGTALNMFLSVLAAYPLSRPNYQGRKLGMTLFTITMMFGAGIIPKYLLMSSLHLTNTRWALILCTAISAYNMIIIRTYFRNSIPSELIEAARIDGCSELRTLWSVVLPLSKAVLSVVTLYYTVGHWNSYFAALVYLRDSNLQPLQIILRDILNSSKIDLTKIDDPEVLAEMTGAADLVKYALIVVSSAPIVALYPFVQKFFKKGVMIGSVKG